MGIDIGKAKLTTGSLATMNPYIIAGAAVGDLLLNLFGAYKQSKSQDIADRLNQEQLRQMEEKRNRMNKIRNLMSVGSERISRMDFGDNTTAPNIVQSPQPGRSNMLGNLGSIDDLMKKYQGGTNG